MKNKNIIPLFLIFLMFVAGFLLYDNVPDKLPIHWDSNGSPDGYGSKFTALFLLPIITLGMYFFLLIVPYIAVYKKNIKSFFLYYYGIKLSLVIFMGLLYIFSIIQIFKPLNMNYLMMPLVFSFFLVLGYFIRKTKRNYFVGIRTPWTLASENNWKKTNKVGGYAMQGLGVFAIISMFLTRPIIVFFIGIVLYVIFIFGYSYGQYKKEL